MQMEKVLIKMKTKLFEMYQKAASLGSKPARLTLMYANDDDDELDEKLQNQIVHNMLQDCYYTGIAIDINKQKAFELFQEAAKIQQKE
jgi:TPR repeat protein